MKILKSFILCIAAVATAITARAEEYTFSVDKIWDNGMHCAFTSIEKFNDTFYICFREGYSHVFNSQGEADGKIRILCSKNGKKWKSLLLLSKEGYDLRDAKLSITPDGRLMVNMAASIYRNKKLVGRDNFVTFSKDGRNFTELQKINVDEQYRTQYDWLWRVTWYKDTGYTICYSRKNRTKEKSELHLYSTKDGINYTHFKSFELDGYPNESTIRFLEDGRMAIMVRRERKGRSCMWGVSSDTTYQDWTWKSIGPFIGGPDFIVMDSGDIVAGGRTTICKMPKTSIFVKKANGKKDRFAQTMILPSGGDCAYPGFLVVGDKVWVSYYSTHETKKASIYLAKIPLKMLGVKTDKK